MADDPPQATAREVQLLGLALAYAIAAIESAPPERRPGRVRDELVALLHRVEPRPVHREQLAQRAERLTGVLPDIDTDWRLASRG